MDGPLMVIEEPVMSPTIPRDRGKDLDIARRIGEPGWAPSASRSSAPVAQRT